MQASTAPQLTAAHCTAWKAIVERAFDQIYHRKLVDIIGEPIELETWFWFVQIPRAYPCSASCWPSRNSGCWCGWWWSASPPCATSCWCYASSSPGLRSPSCCSPGPVAVSLGTTPVRVVAPRVTPGLTSLICKLLWPTRSRATLLGAFDHAELWKRGPLILLDDVYALRQHRDVELCVCSLSTLQGRRTCPSRNTNHLRVTRQLMAVLISIVSDKFDHFQQNSRVSARSFRPCGGSSCIGRPKVQDCYSLSIWAAIRVRRT